MNRKKWLELVGLLAISLALTSLFGIAFYRFVVAYGVQNEEKNLLIRAVTTAALVDGPKVQALEGNQKDQKSSEYAYLRAQLKSLKSINPDLRFVYIMKLRNNEVIFLVDAEPHDSEDYSAPGDVYDEASPKLLNIFMSKQPFIEGPVADAWGRWISAHAPILDSATDETIAIVGLDIDASQWEKNVLFYKVFGTSIPLFMAIVVIVFSTALFKINIVNIRLNHEITDRKRAEDELQKRENTIQAVFDTTPVGICIVKNRVYQRLNKAWCESFGYREEDLIGRTTEFLYESREEYERIGKKLYEDIFKKGIASARTRLKRSDGEFRDVDLTAKPLAPEILYADTVVVVHDITERKRAEEALRTSQQIIEGILHAVPVRVFWKDKNLVYLGCNAEFARDAGFADPKDIIGKDDYQMGWRDQAESYRGHDRQVIESGRSKLLIEEPQTTPGGNTITLLTSKIPLRSPKGEIIGVLGTYVDITDRKQAEEALKGREESLKAILAASPNPMVIYDSNGAPLYINPVFTDVFGWTWDELKGHCIPFVPEDQKKTTMDGIQKIYRSGSPSVFETQRYTKDGRTLDVIVNAAVYKGPNGPPAGMVVNFTDISERKSLQAQYEQTQKMESIGTLAGGIAHDFNNLLMGIQGRASLMAFNLEPVHPNFEHINAIEEYVRSASELTRQLLGFARGGKYEVKPIDINEVALSSSTMFGRTRKQIQIHTKLYSPTPVAEADRGQIEQVLLNMYINAWQAMPNGGEIYLETEILSLDDQFCKPHLAAPGRFVKISITDTGIGMDAPTRRRIFDPFFSTKEKGRGTGLGLASAYGIVKNHGGMVTVHSEMGHGTTFNIYLPVSDKAVYRDIPMEGGLFKGSERILLVDDEELIIDVGHAMLEKLGYQVVVAKGGQQAVEALKSKGTQIDLVILDLIMPGMDGANTFDRIQEIAPRMSVILSSGYSINDQASEILRRGCNGFIQKPFNMSELSKIRLFQVHFRTTKIPQFTSHFSKGILVFDRNLNASIPPPGNSIQSGCFSFFQ